MNFVFASIILLLIYIFVGLEYQSFLLYKSQYFYSFWRILEICSIILNIGFIVSHLAGANEIKMRPFGAITVIVMWCKLIKYLKLFRQTAPLVRMIMQIVSDMKTFSIVFALAVISFGNCFFILTRIDRDYEKCNAEYLLENLGDQELAENCKALYVGSNLVSAFTFSFMIGVGEYELDNFE